MEKNVKEGYGRHSLVAQTVEFTCNAGDPGSIPGLGRYPGEGHSNHSSILDSKVKTMKKYYKYV